MNNRVAMVNGKKAVELTAENGSWRLRWERNGKSHSQSFVLESAEKWFNQLVELLRSSGEKVEVKEIKP